MVTKKIILGTSLTTVLGILIYLSTLQGVSITTSGDIKCLGTLENPCVSYFNITSNYYTLKFFNTSNQKLSFSPEVKDYKIYRFTYGKWKEINFPINMTKGTKYQFKLVGYKKTLFDNIKWSIGMGDTEIDPWWNTTFVKRNNITVSGMGAAARINYPVGINITYASGMNANFNDLRFLNDTTSVDYWIESNVTSSWVYVWIKIPYLPSSPNVTISMYYGSGDTQTTSDGVSTFLLFDDFNDNSFNTTKWKTNAGTPTEQNGYVLIDSTDDIESYYQPTMINVSLETRANITTTGINIGFYNDTENSRALFQPANTRTQTSDGVVTYYQSFGSMTYPLNSWDTWIIYINRTQGERNNVEFYKNTTKVTNHTENLPATKANARLYGNGASFDWIFIRNYTFPDAQASITSEETYTAPPVSMSLSVQMPQYIGYSTEDTTTDSNLPNSYWNNNYTLISGGYTSVISSGTITTNNASQSSWNESFTGNQNNIFYVRIKKTSNVTGGTLDLSGYNSTNTTNSLNTLTIVENFDNSSEYKSKSSGCSIPITSTLHNTQGAYSTIFNRSSTGICAYNYYEDTWDNTTSIANLMDTNVEVCVDVWIDSSTSGIASIQVALTDYEDINYISWRWTEFSIGENYLCKNFSYYNDRSGDITQANSTEISFFISTYSPSQSWFYMDNLRISNYTSPSNPHLDVGGDSIWNWNYTGIFNVTNNKTYDFSSDMRDYISTCSPNIQGYCDVPFILYSDSGGKIQISSMQINYTSTTANWTINPSRYGWYKFPVNNLNYFDTATLNLYQQPTLNNSYGYDCNSSYPCVTNLYYSSNQTWSGISWNTNPTWLNYIIEKKNFTSNIGWRYYSITNQLKSIYSNVTYMLRIPMQNLDLKSMNFTKSGYSSSVNAYYRPYSYTTGGGLNYNATYAYDNNSNDTTTFAQTGGDGASVGTITYNFNIGNNGSSTIFYTYNGTSGGVQLYNYITSSWDTVGTSSSTLTTGSTSLVSNYIDSIGSVSLRITSAGISTGAITRLWDTYINVYSPSSFGPYINASVTKYQMNASSCISLGSMPCYQNGSFTPKGQTNSQWIWNITNVGTINGSVNAYWSQNLPSCMKHYLSTNYTFESSVDYNVSSTNAVSITSLNTSQSQQFWGFFVLNNCTAGYWINSTLVFG